MQTPFSKLRFLPLLALFLPSIAFSADSEGKYFAHKDWEIACDNTLTCRAAGYSDDEQEHKVSLLLTRQAGPGTTLTGEVMWGDDETEQTNHAENENITLYINGVNKGESLSPDDGEATLTEQQIIPLLNALKGDGKIEFKWFGETRELSGAGAYAILLKMDEIQGRIGTTSAITRPGNKTDVLPALPAPTIHAVIPLDEQPRKLTAIEQSLLLPKLMATLGDECDERSDDDRDGEGSSIELRTLNDKTSLISMLCWRAAYNEGYAFWTISNDMKSAPQLITTSGTDYYDGNIDSSQKGRGLGDCRSMESWVWDGATFRQSDIYTTGLCRLIRAGGSWTLPTWTTTVIQPEKPAK
ncbi:DUF1176 domain-containing protein [Brenneria izadpanahii]|uniref:DUF1176 domain-containing protein n=1 Tax=Brenneria izadpanahii TaxID=2722756 RepID=A0ABX7UR84_9GAMM|nr:DUF1176 domain-containing protein [Brenneria izadpanahii]QTF08241.1 DUF1176 domain-containing protein [Brenneria izadpanahii]